MTGTKRQHYPCRCRRRACQARITLKRHPDSYKIPRKCPRCGGPVRLDLVRHRRAISDRGALCYDDCYHYPHAYGHGKCKHRERYKVEQSFKPRSRHHPHPSPDTDEPGF